MINQFQTIANRLPDILDRITSAKFANKDFDVAKPLPYHDNRIKLVVPLDRATDITITLTRTRAGKRISYNPETILKYYRKASITVGPRNSNRCYHVNLRFYRGEIVPLKCDINMTRKIDEKHHAFPQFNANTVNEAINRALHAQPVADSEYPTNFLFE